MKRYIYTRNDLVGACCGGGGTVFRTHMNLLFCIDICLFALYDLTCFYSFAVEVPRGNY